MRGQDRFSGDRCLSARSASALWELQVVPPLGLEKLAKLTGFRIKMQEAGGMKLSMLFSTELAKGEHCGRAGCPPCMTDVNRPNCKQSSVLYESKCLVCNPTEERLSSPREEQTREGRKGIYYGETSRSLHERASEHIKDATSFSEGSHIIKH